MTSLHGGNSNEAHWFHSHGGDASCLVLSDIATNKRRPSARDGNETDNLKIKGLIEG